MRIGIGFDVHKLTTERRLILGGVEIPYKLGLAGHSDADVLTHAIADSVLGAAALGDIGKHFPDTSRRYKDISSIALLKKVYEMVQKAGYIISNIDSTVVAQEPRIAPFIEKMRRSLACALGIETEKVSVKATTTEGLGFEGKGEGISAFAVCLLENNG